MTTDYNLAVCGAGPAGIGFLLVAYKKNKLNQMIEDGLVIIDKSNRLGGGNLGIYNMTANTTASTFLEVVTNSDHDNIFEEVIRTSATFKEMDSKNEQPVALKLVSKFLEEISLVLLKYIEDKGGVILKQEEIVSCQKLDNSYSLETCNTTSKQTTIVTTTKIIMNFGATQNRSTSISILENSDYLEGYSQDKNKVLTTNNIIASPADSEVDIQENMSIVGASHSAFSAIEIISKSNKCKNINLIYYPPIRIQYPSESAAIEDGYQFDKIADVCPITRSVNRYGGLRFAARDIALEILKTGKIPNSEINISLIEINGNNISLIQSNFDESDRIVTCFGYEANLPIFLDEKGAEFKVKMRGLGVFVDSNGSIFMETGEKLDNIYAFGIGSGLSISEDIGGEKSFQGRVDGVWLYQNDIGEKIFDNIY